MEALMVIGDAHTTADKPPLNAKQVITYLSCLWSEYIPTINKIEVLSTRDYLNEAY